MTWTMVNVALSVLFVTASLLPTSTGSCPNVCTCKWKGGKQTVECLERALITVPENIDGETQVLDMSGNNLQIIPSETFARANLTNLQKIYLRSCRIGQIGERAFGGLTNLVELDLSHNLLTAVPSATFEDTPFLRYLSLANNPIQKIEANAFRSVAGVAKIDLSDCDLQSISADAFDKLESLEWLKLNGNKLSHLHPKTVDAMTRLHGIELHDNPWSCDCNLRSVKEWLSQSNIPYSVEPKCATPERISGRVFGDLGVDDFACKPEILPVSRYVEATTGENATVSCRVGAVPSPDIHWYSNGRLLLNNSAFTAFQQVFIFEEGKYEKTSSLVLTNVLDADSGEFYCVAENRAGTAEANFTVNVSTRSAGMAALGSGEIAGLGAALLILVLTIVLVALVVLIRFRNVPDAEGKTPGQLPVAMTTLNVAGVIDKRTEDVATDKDGRTKPRHGRRRSESSSSTESNSGRGGVLASSGNNPDVVPNGKPASVPLPPLLPAYFNSLMVDCGSSGGLEDHRSNTCESFSSANPWQLDYGTSELLYGRNPTSPFDACDRTPIIEEDGSRYPTTMNPHEYPPDYGLPILDARAQLQNTPSPLQLQQQQQHPTEARGPRVWQRGIPVLPPAPALRKVFIKTRNSPDEGYQEGCGTDV